jgi:hypothetical protein
VGQERSKVDIQYGTIKRWPGKLRSGSERVRAPFKSGLTGTLELLERELRMVSAESAVVQLATTHFRKQDGRPYSDVQPDHPGVIVSFVKVVKNKLGEKVRVPLSFPADRFKTWETNLRAVAIALEDLRRIDRYGVTQNAEQYLGFKALPPPGPEHEAIVTVDDAAKFVIGAGFDHVPVIKSADYYRNAYRNRAAKLHPDANGDPGEWAKLQAAKSLLDEHHAAPVTP